MRPRARDASLTHRLTDLIFIVISGHLVAAEHWKHGLSGEHRGKALHHIGIQRRADTAGVGRIGLQPAVMEHHGEVPRAQIEEGRRIARDALLWRVFGICPARRAKPDPPITD